MASNTESGWPLVLSSEATVPSQTTQGTRYMIKYLAVGLFAFAACATPSTPGEYQRGTYVTPVRPAPARPGVGAPVVGQPGQDPNTYPRTPYSRVLPIDETNGREPGLWSAEVPKASRDNDPDYDITFLSEVMPLPKNPTERERRFAAGCVELSSAAFGESHGLLPTPASLLAHLMTIPKGDWACIAARAQQECISKMLGLQLEEEARGRPDAATKKELERLKAVTDRFEAKMCGRGLSAKASDTIRRIKNWYEKSYAKRTTNKPIH